MRWLISSLAYSAANASVPQHLQRGQRKHLSKQREIQLPSRISQGGLLRIVFQVRLLHHSLGERLLSHETLAPGVPGVKTFSRLELQKPDKTNVEVSERSISSSSQLHDHPIGTLR